MFIMDNNIEKFKLKEIKIKDIYQSSIESWIIKLVDEDNRYISVSASIGQITNILFGISKIKDISKINSIYQVFDLFVKENKQKIQSVIIDNVDELFSTAKIEIKINKNLSYFDIETGDAIALALINDIPIYTLNYLLEEEDEEDNSDFIFLE